MEEPTASELAAALNVKIWKFHPPMPSGSKHSAFILQFARKGEPARRIAQLGGFADSKLPLTITLHTPDDISSASSSRVEVFLAQGGISGKTAMDNYFSGHAVTYSTPLRADNSGRIVLAVAGEGNTAALAGSADNDLVLFLTVEPR